MQTVNIGEKLTHGLNEAQKKAVEQPLESCTKVIAGAGTGKTKIISKRYVKLYFELLKSGVKNPAEHILVITFTDKAAAEMKSRIFTELQENGVDTSFGEFWISTFHGFCNMILRKHAQEAGLTPEYTLADSLVLDEIYKNIVRKISYVEIDEIEDIDEIVSDLGLSKDILLPGSLSSFAKCINVDELFNEIYELIKKIKSSGMPPKEFLQKTIEATKKCSERVSTIPFEGDTRDEFTANWEAHLKPYTSEFCENGDYFKILVRKGAILAQNRSPNDPKKWSFASGYPENIEKIEESEILITKICALIYEIFRREMKRANVADFDDLINLNVL